MKYKILIIIFIIAIISSAILSFIPPEQACGGTQTGCYEVNQSGYEKTLGIKNSYFGLTAFTFLTFLTFSHIRQPKKIKKQLIVVGIIVGSIIAGYLIYLQHFVIGSYCKYCMIIDVGTILSLILVIFWKEK